MNRYLMRWAVCSACLGAPLAMAQEGSAPVLVSGTVADEASKAALLARLREVFGAQRVVDQLQIGRVSAPEHWQTHVNKLISPNLKTISAGQLKIDGNNVSVRGSVDNEAQRQQIAADMAAVLNASYTVSNGLRVRSIPVPQDRTVEFESGKAVLTDAGKAILDEVIAIIKAGQFGRINVVGHTDNDGARSRNLALSLARAEAVKAYAIGKGIAPDMVLASGEGPDRPLVDNASAAGRARNRRIEFRVVQ